MHWDSKKWRMNFSDVELDIGKFGFVTFLILLVPLILLVMLDLLFDIEKLLNLEFLFG